VTTTERTAYELPTWAPLPARADAGFDELAARVARELQVRRVLVVLTSKSGQVYPGAHGLPEPWNSRRSMPLSQSMSAQVAGDGRPMVVRDAREHAGLRDRFAVREMSVVGFAAVPLLDVHGQPVGVLSAGDDRPRDWTEEELSALRRLAGEASALLRVRALELAQQEAAAASRRDCAAAQQSAEDAQAALREAEAAADRARIVARLAQELLPAETLVDVLRGVDRFLRSPLGAVRALVGLAESGSAELQVWATVAGDQPPVRGTAGLRLGDPHPLAVAVRERKVVQRSVVAETSVSVPVLLGHHTSAGGLLVGWTSGRVVDDPLLTVVGDLARHVGHALDRVLLRDQQLRPARAGSATADGDLELDLAHVGPQPGEAVHQRVPGGVPDGGADHQQR
jgi:signal transduction histidine kinase